MFRCLYLFTGIAFLSIVITALAQAPAVPPGGVPGGPFPGFRPIEFPQPGQILSSRLQEQLKLDAEQKKQLTELQKMVDAQLAKTLTEDQKKSLKAMRPGRGGFGPPGPRPAGGPGARPAGPPIPGGFPGAVSRSSDVKKQIGATDEEWKVIGPKLQKVLAARRVLTGEADLPLAASVVGERTSSSRHRTS